MGCARRCAGAAAPGVGSRCVTTGEPHTFAEPTSSHIISATAGGQHRRGAVEGRELEGLADRCYRRRHGLRRSRIPRDLRRPGAGVEEPVIRRALSLAVSTTQCLPSAAARTHRCGGSPRRTAAARHAEYLAVAENRLAAPFSAENGRGLPIAQRRSRPYLDPVDPPSTAPAAAHPAP